MAKKKNKYKSKKIIPMTIQEDRFNELKERKSEQILPINSLDKNSKSLNADEKQVNSAISNLGKMVRWGISIIIGSLITLIALILTANITMKAVEQSLIELSMFSSNSVIIVTAAMCTSIVWILIDKLKIYQRIFNFINKTTKKGN
jgi:hypothetical protein